MKKGKRIKNVNVPDLIKEIKEELKAFLVNQNLSFKDVPEFKKICELEKTDKDVELVAERYIDSKIPSLAEIEDGVENMVRETIAFNIRYQKRLEGANK